MEERYVIGTETDISSLKANGGPGDYLIYPKEDDRNFPMRIAFMKSGGSTSVVQKLKIKKSERGYSFQGPNPAWFRTMSDMIDRSPDENSKRLRNAFLGCYGSTSSEPISPPYEEDEDAYAPIPEPVFESPQPRRTKPPVNLPQRNPHTENNGMHVSPMTKNKRKPPTPNETTATFKIPISLPQPIDTDLDPPSEGSDPDSDIDSKLSSPDIGRLPDMSKTSNDLLGNKAPTDVKILYHRDNVKKILKDKPDGAFIVHQGDKNSFKVPYTIYANKVSTKDPTKVRLCPAYVEYNDETKEFSVTSSKKPYSTLKALLEANKKSLRNHLDVQ